MKVHMCAEPGCHTIIPFSDRYCSIHAKAHQSELRGYRNRRSKLRHQRYYNLYERDQEANAFYHSKQWKSIRDYVTARDMYTDGVDGSVLDDHDLIVDHIVRRDLVDDPLETSNLWCLSRRHHNLKTKLEQNILRSPNGKNKLKHISKTNWIKYIQHADEREKHITNEFF